MRRCTWTETCRSRDAEAGATWLDFDSATLAYGLVTPGGVVGSTGVAASHSGVASDT